MKWLTVVLLLTVTISCVESESVSEIERDPLQISQNSDFLELPYGQPESSNFKSLKWGELTGSEKEKAKSEYIDFSIQSEAMASKILENLEPTNINNLYEAIPVMQKRIEEMRLTQDTFLAEQYVAFNLQRLLFNNQLFTVEDIDQNKNLYFDTPELALLEFSLELMVENGNPNAELMALNAFHLKDYIGEEKLKLLASRSISNAERWFSNEQSCINCEFKVKEEDQNAFKLNSVKEGIKYLSQF